ncbi:hypothetical protein G6F35_018310 [Rhizopus arrhizus]|nr:hypothetical protein G6F35_018310 [Rhizopus arrhizus]
MLAVWRAVDLYHLCAVARHGNRRRQGRQQALVHPGLRLRLRQATGGRHRNRRQSQWRRSGGHGVPPAQRL